MNEIGYLQGVGRMVVPVNTCLTIPFHLILTLIIMGMFYMLRKSTKMQKRLQQRHESAHIWKE